MRQLLLRLRPLDASQWIFAGFLGLLLGGGGLALLLRQPALLVPALAVPGLVLVLARWQWLYYLLFLTLPFSRDIELLGGLHMDVPSEPLLLSLLVCVPLALLLGPGGPRQLPPPRVAAPAATAAGPHAAWAAFDTLFRWMCCTR